MKITFRWYGPGDRIPLDYIRQIPGMTGVVSAVYSCPPGEVWPMEEITALRDAAKAAGLDFDVVESVPVHEDIKRGAPDAARYIRNYAETIRRLGAAGVRVVCYNFMPVFDWLRSDLARRRPDGSLALAYDDATVRGMNPLESELSLPGWDESYTKAELRGLIEQYRTVDEEALWRNLGTFLDGVIPACEESGVRLAIHPDDPPWGIFGLPRIITSEESVARLFALNPSPCNGLTLCFGSLGASPENDLEHIIRRFGSDRIPFVHARNVQWTGDHCFEEAGHRSADGSLDLYALLRALYETGFDGYIRPDHGRMIFGETGCGGYGLYDRALGAAYLNGLWEAIEKEDAHHGKI